MSTQRLTALPTANTTNATNATGDSDTPATLSLHAEHVPLLQQRQQLIDELLSEARQYQAQAQRAQALAQMAQESLSLWLAGAYDLDILHGDSWQVDLAHGCLKRG